MKRIASGQSRPSLNPFGFLFSIISFFVKFVGFFIMMLTLVTGAIMSLALFFGFKKLAGKKQSKPKSKLSKKPFKTSQNINSKTQTEVIDVEAEVLED